MKKTKTLMGVLIGCVLALGIVSPVQAVTISYDEAITANWSATDKLNGNTPTVSEAITGSAASFSDATSPTVPTANVHISSATFATITWDIGDAPGGQEWQLDSFTIWIAGGDGDRDSFEGDLYTSTNGTDYSLVTGSHALLVDSDSGTGAENRVSYTFSADEVKGFRYLRLTTEQDGLHTGVFRQPRFREVDAGISAVPEPATMSLLLLGLPLALRRRRK